MLDGILFLRFLFETCARYLFLPFSHLKGVLRGGKVTNYLLEKSRVAGQAPGERCFHVMHYLLEGATAREQSEYRLLPAE